MSKVKDGRYVAPFEGLYDEDGVQVVSGQDDRGRELPDPVPTAPPVGYKPPPPLADMIRRMVHSELLARVADAGDFDTPEEADDFDIPDDPIDPKTPYEAVFDLLPPGLPPEGPAGSPRVNSQPLTKGATSDVPSPSEVPPAAAGGVGANHSEGIGRSDPQGAAGGAAA